MSASGLAAHLSPAELGQRYRAARSPVERSHLQIVWLLSRGRGERGRRARGAGSRGDRPPPQLVGLRGGGRGGGGGAGVPGGGGGGGGETARRYGEGGPDGLGDRRRGNAGARPLLGAEDEAALRVSLAAPPSDGGLWTGPKVAAWMGARLGRKV